MNRIYWDSMIFIYLLEGNPAFAPRVKTILERMKSRGDRLLTSVFTVGEVLTGPRRLGAQDVATKIKQWFESGSVELLPFDLDTADRYSSLRATGKMKQADAIQLATASVAGVDAFLTNDKELLKLTIPGIRFIVDLHGNLF
jgi:uncharacterized protein